MRIHKFLLFLLGSFFSLTHIVYPNISAVKSSSFLEYFLFPFPETASRFQSIILLKLKKNSMFEFEADNSATYKEFIYFFHKMKFHDIPFHYLVFEDGTYIKGFENFEKKSNLLDGQNSINLFLVYKEKLDLKKFFRALDNLLNQELGLLILVSDISKYDDIKFLSCSELLQDKKNCFYMFDADFNTLVRDVFGRYLSASKLSPQLNVDFGLERIEVSPGVLTEMNVIVQNVSNTYVFFSQNNLLEIKAKNDSQFFVNDVWLNARTVHVVNSGVIKPNSFLTIPIRLQSPVLPGLYTENFLFISEGRILTERKLEVLVSDIGQKVIRIRPNYYGFINLYSQANLKSEVIARVPSGALYMVYDEYDNFFKIKSANKLGWVSKSQVEIVR